MWVLFILSFTMGIAKRHNNISSCTYRIYVLGNLCFLLKKIILEKRKAGEKERQTADIKVRKKHQLVAFHTCPDGMCPDLE